VVFNLTGNRMDPVMSYNFLVTLIDSSSIVSLTLGAVGLVPMAGFSECTGLDMTLQVEDYKAGGMNDRVLKFPSRITWSNIRLKRGIALSNDLWEWHYRFVDGDVRRRDGTIVLQDDQQRPIRTWRFRKGLPVKWTGPTLDANQSRVAIEELEIAHEGIRMLV
jgi:phage tail-like protein